MFRDLNHGLHDCAVKRKNHAAMMALFYHLSYCEDSQVNDSVNVLFRLKPRQQHRKELPDTLVRYV